MAAYDSHQDSLSLSHLPFPRFQIHSRLCNVPKDNTHSPAHTHALSFSSYPSAKQASACCCCCCWAATLTVCMFVQFCSQNLPSFEPFWGFFGLDPHWVHEEQASSCLLSLSLPPSPNSRIVCLSVCLSVFCLWIVRLQIVFCVPVLKQSCILDFLIFIGLCVWLDFGDREEGSKEGRKEGGELGLLCRCKNSSAAAGVFGELQIFCCQLLKFQLPVIIRRSFCSSLPRLLCNLLMMFFFGSFGSWVLTSCGVLV